MPVCSISSITAVINLCSLLVQLAPPPDRDNFPQTFSYQTVCPPGNHHHHQMVFLKWPKQQCHHEENRCQTFSPWDNNFPETFLTEIPASLPVPSSRLGQLSPLAACCPSSQVESSTLRPKWPNSQYIPKYIGSQKKQILIIRW